MKWIVMMMVVLMALSSARGAELSAAEKRAVNDANEYVMRGNQFVEKNSLPRAKSEYERALKMFPKHLDALYNLAVVCEKLKQMDEAIGHYKRYLELMPNDADVWTQLGVRYDEGNQRAEAKQAYEKALACDANFGRAHHNLGVLLKEDGEMEAAQKHLETFVNLEEKAGRRNGDAYYSLGVCHFAQGKLPEAKRLLQKALDDDPSVPYYNNAMGDIYAAGKDFEAALVCYKKAIAKDDKYAHAYSGMGDAYRNLKQAADAAKAYEKALQLRPDYHLIHFKLGLLHEESAPATAIKHFEKYLASGKKLEFAKDARERIEKLKQPKKQ